MLAELHYSRSPLTEAVIDLQVRLPHWVTLDFLAQIQTGQEVNYPTRQDRILVQGQLSTNPNMHPTTGSRTHIGYSFISTDKRRVAQARLDGFTFSWLAPYESWEVFRDEARRWWTIYRNTFEPKAITRVAVRYINRLDLPLPVRDLKEYLRTVPEVSPDLPQDLSDYFMQLHIPQEDLNGMLILNQALVPPSQPNIASILLDIDLFREIDIPSTEDELWDFLEHVRHRKNEVFEACITNLTRELIR